MVDGFEKEWWQKVMPLKLFSNSGDRLKVRQFQNEFMKSSFLPKYEQKIVRISALCSEGRNFDNILFVFWEKGCLHKFILKLIDL